MKILHLPTTVGAQGWGLAQAEKKIGLDSHVLIRRNNFLNYPFDMSMELEKCSSSIEKLYKSMKWFYKVCKSDYDILHFNFGSTIMDFTHIGLGEPDLPFYRRKGRGLFVTFNGCDVRQKYRLMKEVDYSACHNDKCSIECNDPKCEERKKRNVINFDKYVDGMFAITPDLLRFLPERAVYLPKTISSWDNIDYIEKKDNYKIKIIHAPTDRIIKGTEYIIDAIRRLEKKYDDIIEFKLIENMSNKEALEAYCSADLVVDQLMIGWYGGLAVEVMKMGKPVMCFIRESDYEYINQNMARDCREAIISVDKNSIFEKLCELVENRALLRSYGEKAYDYVNTWHDPIVVARMVKRYYDIALNRS